MAKDTMQEVQVSESTSVVLPSLKDMKVTGFENVTMDDTATPFLKLLQKMSPETEEGTADYIDGAKAGQIVNSVTKQLYESSKGVLILPCFFKREYIEWEPREKSQGAPVHRHSSSSDILARTTRGLDNKDVLENGNYIENTAQWYGLLIGKEGENPEWTPAMVSMKSTQLKRARSWMSLIRETGSPVMFSHLYRLTSTLEQNAKGNWYSWVINRERKLDVNWNDQTGSSGDLMFAQAAYELAVAVHDGDVDSIGEPAAQDVPF